MEDKILEEKINEKRASAKRKIDKLKTKHHLRWGFPHEQGTRSLYFGNKFSPIRGQNPRTRKIKVMTSMGTDMIREFDGIGKFEPVKARIIPSHMTKNGTKVRPGVFKTISVPC